MSEIQRIDRPLIGRAALFYAAIFALAGCASQAPAPAPAKPAAPAAAAPKPAAPTPAASAGPTSAGAATSASATSWSEQFSAKDATSFFSPAYAALPGDASKPLYAITGGTPTVANGEMTLANARFTVGALGNAATGSSTPGGIFAMNGKTCTLTVNVKSKSSGGNFFVYVDNNSTSQGNSPHGNASRAVSVGAASLQIGANTFKLSIASAGFSSGSFLQLRADSAASIVIDSASLACS